MNADPYQKLAKIYDKFIEPFNTVLRKIMLRMYSPEKGMHVLEIGCGTGTNLKLYHQAGCFVHGVDLSSSMLNEAHQKLSDQADLNLANASQMPYSDNVFDIVVAMLTLHEMPKQIRVPVITEMARILKPDGRLIFVDFHPGPIQFPKGWFYKTVILFFELIAGREHFKNFRTFIAGKGLPHLLEKTNLLVEKERIISSGNISLYVVKLN